MKHLSVALGVLLLAVGLSAQDAEEKRLAKKFEQAVKKLERSAAKGKFTKLDDKLEKLLQDHAYAPYAIAARSRLEALLLKRALADPGKRPTIQTILADATIKKADPTTGEIEMSWTRDKIRGLNPSTNKVARFFPFSFDKGDFTVEVEGRKYPGTGNSMVVTTLSGNKKSLSAAYGRPSAGKDDNGHTCGIFHAVGDRNAAIDRKSKPAFKPGKKWKVKVKVTKKKIVAYANGKSIMSAARPEGLKGSVGFTDLKGWTKATIKGKSETDAEPWLFLKKNIEQYEESVRKRFKAADHLPEWMFEK